MGSADAESSTPAQGGCGMAVASSQGRDAGAPRQQDWGSRGTRGSVVTGKN